MKLKNSIHFVLSCARYSGRRNQQLPILSIYWIINSLLLNQLGISWIRVEGHKVLANENAEDRENLLVKAFINGLSNRKVSEVLNHLSPKNLDEAFKLVKYEKTEDSSASINS